MKIKFIRTTAACVITALITIIFIACRDSPVTTPAQETVQAGKPASLEKLDSAFDQLVHADAVIDTLAQGFEWSEGPVWIEELKTLIFSDVPANTIYKWTEAGGKEVYLTPSGYTGKVKRGGETGSNGLTLNAKRQLVLCQHGDRRIAVMNAPLDHPKADFINLASQFKGKRFDSPNDVVFAPGGDFFFTDPPYGLEKFISDSSKDAPYQGVFKVNSSGEVTLLTDSITRPNGIALFPDGRSIIIANSDPDKAIWYLYDLDKNNLLINGRIFYDATVEGRTDKGSPDGLKIDREGNVFASGPGGIWVFDKKARVLGKIRIGLSVSNCALGDDDKTLYVTADNYILRVKMR